LRACAVCLAVSRDCSSKNLTTDDADFTAGQEQEHEGEEQKEEQREATDKLLAMGNQAPTMHQSRITSPKRSGGGMADTYV
jgi:hypothetical protein